MPSLHDVGLFSATVGSLCCKVSIEYIDLHRSEKEVSVLTEEEEFLMSFDPSVLGTRGSAPMEP